MDYHSQPDSSWPRTALHNPDAVKDISELALRIITLVQRAKRSADIIRRLIQHACMVVCAIIYHCNQTTAGETAVGVRKDIQDNFQELFDALSSIKRLAEKEATQNAFMRIVKHIFYLKRIQKFRDDLGRILGLFGLSSSNLIEETLEQIASRLTSLKELASMKQEEKASLHKEPLSTHITSMAKPIYNRYRQGPVPAYICSTEEQCTETTIGGDQTNVNTTTYITSFNSGNTVTTITENSNNHHDRLYYADISTLYIEESIGKV
ncbi:hypothetical protein L208DRAFT_1374226 [Tricholoma matsutake]|nr:hypothetical protein L208DRAFT_1374226 [Tricholoma matsutake 945]